MIRELSENYGVTFVLASATQPDLFSDCPRSPPPVREIVANHAQLIQDMRRVNISVPKNLDAPMSMDDVADMIAASHCSSLTILNTKAQAKEAYEALLDRGIKNCYHLSGNMCGAHRLVILDKVRDDLVNRRMVHVISTSLIEAGVDVDFPLVIRALAGLDSLAQAAGRCNREGKMPGMGDFRIIITEENEPTGTRKKAKGITKNQFLRRSVPTVSLPTGLFDLHNDLFSDQNFNAFFAALYGPWDDKHRVLMFLKRMSNFRAAAHQFNIIPDDTATVLVPYVDAKHDGIAVIDAFRKANSGIFVPDDLFALSQRLTVTVYNNQAQKLRDEGVLIHLDKLNVWYTHPEYYDANYGLTSSSGIAYVV